MFQIIDHYDETLDRSEVAHLQHKYESTAEGRQQCLKYLRKGAFSGHVPKDREMVSRAAMEGKWQEAEKLFFALGMHEKGGEVKYAALLASNAVVNGGQHIAPYWERPQADQEALMAVANSKKPSPLDDEGNRQCAAEVAKTILMRFAPHNLPQDLSKRAIREIYYTVLNAGLVVAYAEAAEKGKLYASYSPKQKRAIALLTSQSQREACYRAAFPVLADQIRSYGYELVDNYASTHEDYRQLLDEFVVANPNPYEETNMPKMAPLKSQ